MLKVILGSTITVSTRNGFPRAAKWLQAANDYLFSKQIPKDFKYINAVLPDDEDEDGNSSNGYYFVWTHETEKLRVSIWWEKLKITDESVLDELQRPTQGDCSEHSLSWEDGSSEIKFGDDFTYDQALFEIQNVGADSLIRCVVIESSARNWIVGQCKNFCREFVLARMRETYAWNLTRSEFVLD